jgi:hypothetical protein
MLLPSSLNSSVSALPPGATFVAASVVPSTTGEGGFETAVTLLILTLVEAIRLWIRTRTPKD